MWKTLGERIIQLMLISSIYHATKAIELTTDSKFLNGLCPEVAVWTCSLTTTDPIIRFYLKRGNSYVHIDGQNHPTGFELQYTDNQFIDKGEYTLSEPEEDLSENITRTLTVNNEELYNLGYRHIGCETFLINTTTPLNLDREVPTRPEVMSTNILVNTTSSLASVQIRTSSMVYNSSRCQYRKNSYFITRVFSEQQVHTWQTNFNSSSCTGSDCVITGSFPQPVAPGNVTIEVEAVSQCNRSIPYNISIPKQNFIMETDDCTFQIKCYSSDKSCNICMAQFQSISDATHVTAEFSVNKYYTLYLMSHHTYELQVTFKCANVTITYNEGRVTAKQDCSLHSAVVAMYVCIGFLTLITCVTGTIILLSTCYLKKSSADEKVAAVKRECLEKSHTVGNLQPEGTDEIKNRNYESVVDL